MSRPTDEQIKALKPGDEYTVRLRLSSSNSRGMWGQYPCGAETFHLTRDIQSILPREIKVGDMVRRTGWGGEPWEVVAGPRPCKSRPAEYAVWRAGDGFESAPADNLEVVS